MNYREKIYSKYRSSHIKNLIGDVDLSFFKKQFCVWSKYYGEFLPKDKNVKILDIACGDGGIVYWLQSIGYKNSFGIDISEEQVNLAKSLGIENIEQYDLKEFLKTNKGWDVIFALDILEHFNKNEILDVLELIYNALNKNGILIIKTPNGESIFGTRYLYRDFTHEWIFTKSSLMEIFSISGFKKFHFKEESPVIHGLFSLIRYILWKFIRLILNFYLLVETGQRADILTQNIIAVAYKNE
jgi:2-polyprenyl-3-methyl-5-hydroxy-6-metoxy-1,4-benzoquinol methylase